MNNNSEIIFYNDGDVAIKNINQLMNTLGDNKNNTQLFLLDSIKLFELIEINMAHLEGRYSFFHSLNNLVKRNLKYLEGEENIKKYNYYINLFADKSQTVTPKTLRKIGCGSYGDVYETGLDTVTKVMDNKISNLVEIFFLKSFEEFSNDFIPKIKNVNLTDCKIEVEMNNCGMNLTNYSKSISYNQRVMMVPSLMIQMARFLVWMKSHNIAHMDIKPDNICIENEKLTFIDWGFVGPICNDSQSYVGTYNFADPTHLEYIKKISHQYDMFSCGLTILSFLCKDFIDPGYNFRHDLRYMLSRVKEAVCTIIGEQYMSILCRMVELNEKSRITPLQLYYHSALVNFQPHYPLLKEVNKDYIAIDIIPMLCLGSESLKSHCEHFNLNHLYSQSFELFSRLKNISGDDIFGYSLGCLYISNIIFYSRTINLLELEQAVNYFNKKYTEQQFKQIIIDICQMVNWQVYPERF